MSEILSNHLQVSLSNTKASAPWQGDSLISFDGSHVLIHLDGTQDNTQSNELNRIKKAARKLTALCDNISVQGHWSDEQLIALLSSFRSPIGKHQVDLSLIEASTTVKHYLKAFNFTVDLVNQTPQQLSPQVLAEQAANWLQTLAPEAISWHTIAGEQLKEQGWHGIYEVGRGSERPPVLLDLDYNPSGDANTPTESVLVGKGITFDSGGYSIKASEGMLTMKCDMAGAATVTGALGLAILNGLQQRTRLILCCAENLISGHAYKLGDIITYKNGTRVEVVNTDAEGRLVLADGLQLAGEYQPKKIIDAATLTGAAVMALGTHYNALFSMDAELRGKAMTIAEQVNEPAWPLPLEPFHQHNCPSPYADTANSRPQKGGGAGGASNAAGFLSRFVPNSGAGWLHMDLAAAFNNHPTDTGAPGGTAQGIRTIAGLL